MKTIQIKCDECGCEFEKLIKEIKRSTNLGRKNYCSRTCSTIYRNKNLTPEFRKKHCYDISKYIRQSDKYSPFKYFVTKSKSRKYKNTNIDVIYLKNLWETQNGICPYTGLKMILPKNTLDYHSKSSCCPRRASLDRIDSSMGYIKGNVEFVCYVVNLAKNGFSKNEMISFFDEIISEHSRLKQVQPT